MSQSAHSRPRAPWRRLAGVALGLSLCAVGTTCGPRQGPHAATPAVGTSSPLPGGPAPPRSGLAVPSLDVAWSPPIRTAGDAEALAEALAEVGAVEVVLGPSLAGWEAQVGRVAAAIAPETRVAGVRAGAQAAMVADAAALAAPREPGSGRPRYAAAGLRLRDTWLKGQDTQAAALLAIDASAVDLPAWNALPAAAVGGCEPAIRALAEGQEQGLAQLEAFLNHADALLWKLYSAELQAFLPELRAELQAYASAAPPTEPAARAQHDCGRAYWDYLQAYLRCDAAERCAVAPRLVLSAGGARIAAPEPALVVSDRCPALVGRDYRSELRQLGRDAAEATGAALDAGWSTLADRIGGFSEVHAALEDVCTPRRWRFSAADLEEARERLARVGQALGSAELAAPQAAWRPAEGEVYAPGVGAVHLLARFDPGPGSINATIAEGARALREFVLSRALCRGGHDPKPLSLMLADAKTGGARFFGYFYAEELVCGELPPLVRAGG